jgi:hypothetical protein
MPDLDAISGPKIFDDPHRQDPLTGRCNGLLKFGRGKCELWCRCFAQVPDFPGRIAKIDRTDDPACPNNSHDQRTIGQAVGRANRNALAWLKPLRDEHCSHPVRPFPVFVIPQFFALQDDGGLVRPHARPP